MERRIRSVSLRPFTSGMSTPMSAIGFLLLLEDIDHGVEVFGLELDFGGPPADGDQQFC